MEREERNCYTCKNLDFGWSSINFDECDYTCHQKKEDGSESWGYLLCVHELTKEEIEEKLKSMGKDCIYWKPKEYINLKL